MNGGSPPCSHRLRPVHLALLRDGCHLDQVSPQDGYLPPPLKSRRSLGIGRSSVGYIPIGVTQTAGFSNSDGSRTPPLPEPPLCSPRKEEIVHAPYPAAADPSPAPPDLPTPAREQQRPTPATSSRRRVAGNCPSAWAESRPPGADRRFFHRERTHRIRVFDPANVVFRPARPENEANRSHRTAGPCRRERGAACPAARSETSPENRGRSTFFHFFGT